jgi:3-hydroxy acid dehydrogenase / malonic semialdehyde reductase
MSDTTAVITGATSGFGRAIALRLAREGRFRLVLTGRRTERLEALKKEIELKFGTAVLALSFDVRSKKETERALGHLPLDFASVALLVNNAGLAAGRDNAVEANTDDWDQMIDTNVKGLMYVTRSLLPGMIAQGVGHIVNIGSIAGKESYPGGSVYCASKFAVDAFTKALRTELLPHGIRVSQICPGAAETEFSLVRFKGDARTAKSVYDGFEPLRAEDIADIVSFVVNAPHHVCINDLVVTPTAQANSFFLHRKSNS